jgi:transcription initiation factor TFIID subunit 11
MAGRPYGGEELGNHFKDTGDTYGQNYGRQSSEYQDLYGDDDDEDEKMPGEDDPYSTQPPLEGGGRAGAAVEEEEDEEEEADAETKERAAELKTLLDSFTPEQLRRYECYRRSSFPKAAIKKLMSAASGQPSINPNLAIVMAGITKVFVGEMVETAKGVMEELKEDGPVRPKHLREAHRRLKAQGKIPGSVTTQKRPLFKRK